MKKIIVYNPEQKRYVVLKGTYNISEQRHWIARMFSVGLFAFAVFPDQTPLYTGGE